MINGNILGPVNAATTASAKGIWTLREQQLARNASAWPFFAGSWSTSSTGYFTTSAVATQLPGDFTIEFWAYRTGGIGYATPIANYYNYTGTTFFFGTDGGNGIAWGSSGLYASYGSGWPTNTWIHAAAVRSGTSLKVYLNGSNVASGTDSTNFNLSQGTIIGRNDNNNKFYGNISNLRITNTVVYTGSSFTVPTSPLTAISGTKLLACRSLSITDTGPNNYAITAYGDSAATTANPFP